MLRFWKGDGIFCLRTEADFDMFANKMEPQSENCLLRECQQAVNVGKGSTRFVAMLKNNGLHTKNGKELNQFQNYLKCIRLLYLYCTTSSAKLFANVHFLFYVL